MADQRYAGGGQHRLALGADQGAELLRLVGQHRRTSPTALVTSLRYFHAMMSGRGTDSKPAERRSADTRSDTSSVPVG